MRKVLEALPIKPHQQEASNAWVFRVLGLNPLDCAGFELRTENGDLLCGVEGTAIENCMRLDVTYHQKCAIESWMQFGDYPDERSRAVAIVICNEDRSAFIVQRKDLLHPNGACKGRYSLFGGSPHVCEDGLFAAFRELLEEIRNHRIIPLHKLKPVADLTLTSVQWPGDYLCQLFDLCLPHPEFNALVQEIVFADNISESVGALVSRQEFERIMFPQEKEEPGRHFLASHHLAIQHLLST